MSFISGVRDSDAPFADFLWWAQSERSGSFISRAEYRWEMVVTKYQGKTTLTVRGPETQASIAPIPEDAEFFGIPFQVGTYMPHMPVSSLVDGAITLPEAAGNRVWLNGAAWEIPTFDNADVFVARLAREGILVRDETVAAVLQGRDPLMSPRAVQYRFLRATGLSHNTIQQIERAKRAMTLLQQGVSILDTVYEAGYFDQPHLTRALKRYLGQTPAQLLRVDVSA